MPAEAPEMECDRCGLTPTEIRRRYPHRVPTVQVDPNARKPICNACWSALPPFGEGRR